MEGFLDLKIEKFARALLTRAVAIIPSLIIAFVHNQENFNHYLNILQAIQLPFALIPLLRLHREERIMRQNTMSRGVFISLSCVGACIVCANYYLVFSLGINFTFWQVLAVLLVALLYFYFMMTLCNEELVIPHLEPPTEISDHQNSVKDEE
jgi:natural resistance-associated macrophage protein